MVLLERAIREPLSAKVAVVPGLIEVRFDVVGEFMRDDSEAARASVAILADLVGEANDDEEGNVAFFFGDNLAFFGFVLTSFVVFLAFDAGGDVGVSSPSSSHFSVVDEDREGC